MFVIIICNCTTYWVWHNHYIIVTNLFPSSPSLPLSFVKHLQSLHSSRLSHTVTTFHQVDLVVHYHHKWSSHQYWSRVVNAARLRRNVSSFPSPLIVTAVSDWERSVFKSRRRKLSIYQFHVPLPIFLTCMLLVVCPNKRVTAVKILRPWKHRCYHNLHTGCPGEMTALLWMPGTPALSTLIHLQ